MLNFRSIRFRLATWYFLSLTVVLSLLAVGSWYGMRVSLYGSIDEVLNSRIIGAQNFLTGLGTTSVAELKTLLQQPSNPWIGGAHHQIFDDQKRLVYQTNSMARDLAGMQGPFASSDTIEFMTIYPRNSPMRLASQRVQVKGITLVIETAEPLRTVEAELQAYTRYLLMGAPLLLLAATMGGFLISRKALSPVDRIIEDARSITASDLSRRLAVPNVNDELQRLSETLNQMLDRIEATFLRTRQFTADASHELRAPITLIHTAAEFSLRRERSHDELLQAMKQIFREAKHTARLVNDLLLLARADSNLDVFRPAPVDLQGLYSEVCHQGQMLASNKGLQVEVTATPDPVRVMGEDSLLERLFLILIDNAIKYTPSGGNIWLGLRQESGRAVFSVRDSGIGIAAEDLPRIWGRFWRADKVRSREMGGTGLGLSIARTIVERHGATISVQSEPGKGSLFEVHLPLAEAQDSPAITSSDTRNSPEEVVGGGRSVRSRQQSSSTLATTHFYFRLRHSKFYILRRLLLFSGFGRPHQQHQGRARNRYAGE
jgi:heavy metal sensor kinase